MSTVESIARPRRNGERRRAPTASISKESPAITGVVEMVIRSEERFSRNAETDLVCRLLLEKKKMSINDRLTEEGHERSSASGSVGGRNAGGQVREVARESSCAREC